MYQGGGRRGLELWSGVEGGGALASSQTVPRPLSSFDTHARRQPVTQSARSRRSYGEIEDCEQSTSDFAAR